jgi:type VI secretion system protein VasJ
MNSPQTVSADPRGSLGAAPIAPDSPAGADCRASPEFEALEIEVRKMEVDGPNAVDWRKAQDAAIDIVARRSKDFLVAAWCAYALFRREGLGGLVVGVAILQGIVSAHWDGAFPPVRRERARVAALDWLIGRLSKPVGDMAFQESDGETLIALADGLRDLEDALSAKLQKEQFSAAELVRLLRPAVDQARRAIAEAARLAAAAIAEAAAPPPAAEPPAPVSEAAGRPAQPVAAVPAGPQAGATLPELNGALDQLAPTLRAYADALRSAQPGDPRAFMLARLASWLRIDERPGVENGRTLVMAPTQALDAIEAARGQKQWPDALRLAEELVWTSPFCLDGHRYAYEALGEMGPAFAAARAAVLGMLRYFAQRHADAIELLFKDGRPFADEATRELARGGASGEGMSAARDEMAVAIGQARLLINAGKPLDALDAIGQTLRRAASGRQRFVWQLSQAQFCVEQGFVGAALPLVEYLDRAVSEQDLERWEPDLAASTAELRLRTLTHSDALAVLSEERRRAALEEARGRMARLDIGAAARLLRA